VQKAQGLPVGPIHLFFGSKHPDHDWLCRDDMQGWMAAGLITLHLAHSAMEGHPHAYVQHVLAVAGPAFWPILNADAQVYVCGDGRLMAPAVREALIDVHEAATGSSRDAASLWLEGLIDAGRYHQDVYGFGK
jgi:cytochrome P450/NADPH-cytochrome P450 reductase